MCIVCELRRQASKNSEAKAFPQTFEDFLRQKVAEQKQDAAASTISAEDFINMIESAPDFNKEAHAGIPMEVKVSLLPLLIAALLSDEDDEDDEEHHEDEQPQPNPNPSLTAVDFLARAAGHMADRAVTYDSPDGERSIAKTVEAFNALTNHNLTAQDGWLLMLLLKIARANQGDFKLDNYEDLVAYSALLSESAAQSA